MRHQRSPTNNFFQFFTQHNSPGSDIDPLFAHIFILIVIAASKFQLVPTYILVIPFITTNYDVDYDMNLIL